MVGRHVMSCDNQPFNFNFTRKIITSLLHFMIFCSRGSSSSSSCSSSNFWNHVKRWIIHNNSITVLVRIFYFPFPSSFFLFFFFSSPMNLCIFWEHYKLVNPNVPMRTAKRSPSGCSISEKFSSRINRFL